MTPPSSHPPCARSAGPRRDAGAGLVEVLIAVLVLSVGLLGFAGAQMTSLKGGHSAYLRSQASLLAYDITDRMRAARMAALAGAFNDDADGDRKNWDDSLVALLGGDATGSVVLDGTRVTVTITWDDDRGSIRAADEDADASDMQTFVYRTEI